MRRAFLPRPPARRIQNSRTKRVEAKQILFLPQNSLLYLFRIAFCHVTLPEHLESRTPKRKTPFPFSKRISPAKSEMQGVFFLSGLPPSPRGGGGARLSERTIQFKGTTRSARTMQSLLNFDKIGLNAVVNILHEQHPAIAGCFHIFDSRLLEFEIAFHVGFLQPCR